MRDSRTQTVFSLHYGDYSESEWKASTNDIVDSAGDEVQST